MNEIRVMKYVVFDNRIWVWKYTLDSLAITIGRSYSAQVTDLLEIFLLLLSTLLHIFLLAKLLISLGMI